MRGSWKSTRGLVALAAALMLGAGLLPCRAREWGTNEYHAADVEKAWDDALRMQRAMVFIYYEEDLDCAACELARKEAVDALRDLSLFIYIDANKDKDRIPVVVWEAIRRPESGRLYPITVVMDTLMTEALDVIPYIADQVERAKVLQRARQAVLENFRAQGFGVPPSPGLGTGTNRLDGAGDAPL